MKWAEVLKCQLRVAGKPCLEDAWIVGYWWGRFLWICGCHKLHVRPGWTMGTPWVRGIAGWRQMRVFQRDLQRKLRKSRNPRGGRNRFRDRSNCGRYGRYGLQVTPLFWQKKLKIALLAVTASPVGRNGQTLLSNYVHDGS